MRRPILLICATLACLLRVSPAFAQTPAPAQPTPPAQSASTIRLAGYPAPGEPPALTLLSAGAEPRQTLQVGPSAPRKEHMDMVMKMTMNMDMGGTALPSMPIPAMKTGMDFEVTEVKPNGDATISIAMTGMSAAEANADPAFVQIMQPINEQMMKMKGTMTVNARGKVLSQNMTIPDLPSSLPGGDSLQTTFQDTLKNMAPPMPEVPLGLGARWETRAALVSQGVMMFQKTISEITALDKNSMTVTTTFEQTAPPQAVVNPALPPGAEMRVESGSGSGSGTAVLRFGELVPATDMTTKIALKILMNAGGQSIPMNMSMELGMKISGTVIK